MPRLSRLPGRIPNPKIPNPQISNPKIPNPKIPNPKLPNPKFESVGPPPKALANQNLKPVTLKSKEKKAQTLKS